MAAEASPREGWSVLGRKITQADWAFMAHINEMLDLIRELAPDARRYAWLREHQAGVWFLPSSPHDDLHHEIFRRQGWTMAADGDFDQTLDAAMQERKP